MTKQTDSINGVSVSAGGYASVRLDNPDASTLYLQATCGNSYSVDIVWKDEDDNVIRTETDALGGALTGGAWNRSTTSAYAPRVEVRVYNDGTAGAAVDGTFKLA